MKSQIVKESQRAEDGQNFYFTADSLCNMQIKNTHITHLCVAVIGRKDVKIMVWERQHGNEKPCKSKANINNQEQREFPSKKHSQKVVG